jgi:hypothetical protein
VCSDLTERGIFLKASVHMKEQSNAKVVFRTVDTVQNLN